MKNVNMLERRENIKIVGQDNKTGELKYEEQPIGKIDEG